METKIKTLTPYDFSKSTRKGRLLGRKVDTLTNGIGIVSKNGDGRIMVRIKQSCRCGRKKYFLYLTDAWTTGDLANVYNKKGQYLGNMRDEYPVCEDCLCKNKKNK